MEGLFLVATIVGLVFICLFILFFIVFLIRKFIFKIRNTENSLTQDQLTSLVFSAILATRNSRGFSNLYGYSRPRVKIEAISIEASLNNEWNIYNREELINTIFWLRYEGHRLSNLSPSSTYNEVFITYLSYKKNNYTLKTIPSNFVEVFKDLEPTYNKLLNKYGFNENQLTSIPSLLAWDLERLINLVIFGYTLNYLNENEAWSLIQDCINENINEFSSWEDYFASFVFGRALWLRDKKFPSTYEARVLLLNKNSIYKKVPYPHTRLKLL